MAERYEVAVKVISQKGTCAYNHKVGDEWIVKETTTACICMSAFNASYPHICALMHGGSFPWSDDPDKSVIACPDPKNPVVFELRRIRK